MGLFRAQRANCNPNPLNIEAPRRFGLDAARRIKKNRYSYADLI